jgi:hypothetical protein
MSLDSELEDNKVIDAKKETTILTGMIISDSLIKGIQPILTDNSFRLPTTKIVAEWCQDHFKEYQESPGRHIQDIFNDKSKTLKVEDKFLIEELLHLLSKKYTKKYKTPKDYNAKCVLDSAEKYFQLGLSDDLTNKLARAVERGDPEKVEKLISEFKTPKLVANPDDVFKHGITARELKDMNIQEAKWLVEDIIPKGLTLLAGKPKVGKSYFLLNLALALSAGEKAFNIISTEPSKVLYLGLEEPTIRTKSRIESILDDGEWSENLHIFGLGTWLKSDDGGHDHLELWMKEHPDTKLIIIDTLAKWKSPKKKSNRTEYEEEYQSVEKLHTFAGKHDVAVIVAHHARKTKADDIFDEIIGGSGLQAAVDTLTVLSHNKKDSISSRIYNYRGRDIGEGNMVFKFEENGRMILSDENASDYNKESVQRRIIQDCIESHGSIKRGDLVDILSRNKQVGKGVDVILRKMVDTGRIEKLGTGKYAYKGCSRDIEYERKFRKSLINCN